MKLIWPPDSRTPSSFSMSLRSGREAGARSLLPLPCVVPDDDPAAVGAKDGRPGNDVASADTGAGLRSADPESLEDAGSSDHEPGDLQRARGELRTEIVDPAERPTRLGAHLAPRRSLNRIRIPGSIRPTCAPGRRRDPAGAREPSSEGARPHRSARPLPRARARSRPRAMNAARRPSRPRPFQTGGPTRIAVTRGSAVANTLDLEVVDVAAASAFAVDELMIEQTQAEVELPRRAHPCP